MKQIPTILLGVGGVGRELAAQIVRTRQIVADRNDMRFNVAAIADSRQWVWSPSGISDGDLLAAIAAKKNGNTLGGNATERPTDDALLPALADAELQPAILVDVTARAGMEPLISAALEMGFGVALANKQALAGEWATARHFYRHPRLRHESTVGGGQPVIATVRSFLDTGDQIHRVEGQLSGTLGFICSQIDAGIPFSQALLAAKVKGYTEPDPREDLSGMDVMRKGLILGRLAGWEMEAADIEVESLYPAALAHLRVEEFMGAAVAIDPVIGERAAAAQAEDCVLRYVAEVENGVGKVGLKRVPANSPTANLKYVSFSTDNYHDEPLTIAGKGAGVEMTAAGVLADMIDLGREMPAFGSIDTIKPK